MKYPASLSEGEKCRHKATSPLNDSIITQVLPTSTTENYPKKCAIVWMTDLGNELLLFFEDCLCMNSLWMLVNITRIIYEDSSKYPLFYYPFMF